MRALAKLRAHAERIRRLRDGAASDGEVALDAVFDELRRQRDELSSAEEELGYIEEELRAQAEALATTAARAEAERRGYLELFEGASVPLLVTDATGAIKEANLAASALVGSDERALREEALSALVHEDERALHDDLLTAAAEGRRAVAAFRLRRADAAAIPVVLEGSAVDGGARVLWVVRPVSRAVDAEGDAASRVAELERAVTDKDELLARERSVRRRLEAEIAGSQRLVELLSSELRGPIHAVLSWSQLLQREVLASRARDRAVLEIERSSRRQLAILEELLSLSRTTGNAVSLEIADLDLAQLLRVAVAAAEPAAEAVGVALDAEASSDDGVRVFGDRRKLAQILDAVLDSFVANAAPGDRVVARTVTEGDHAVLRLAAKGNRVGAELLTLTRERPPSDDDPDTEPARRALRLHLAKQLIELHGGAIEVASEAEGATFALTLPTTRASARARAGRTAQLDHVRVLLLVEDHDVREVVAAILSARRAQVALASSVDAAVDLFASRGADVVVTDLDARRADAAELVRNLREIDASVGVLAVTSHVPSVDGARTADVEIDAELRQPVEPELFVATVLDLAARAAASRR